jgi:hypothetical protein
MLMAATDVFAFGKALNLIKRSIFVILWDFLENTPSVNGGFTLLLP